MIDVSTHPSSSNRCKVRTLKFIRRSHSHHPQNNMPSISRFIVVGLQLSLSHSLNCSSPFTDILSVCLHFPSSRMTWCDAQSYCFSVGGELVRGSRFLSLNNKTFSGQPNVYWVGLTDLLIERGRNRSEWRWYDGSLEPPSSQLAWRPGDPDSAAKDCTIQCSGGKLCDTRCSALRTPMCQPRSLSSPVARAANFQAVSIPVGLAEDDFAQGGGCTKLITKVSSRLECAALCMNEPKKTCVAFYFNEARRESRLVLYADATVNIHVGAAQGWKKFVMKN